MLRKSQNNNDKVERQRTYSEVSDKRENLQPLSLVVLGETTGLFYWLYLMKKGKKLFSYLKIF